MEFLATESLELWGYVARDNRKTIIIPSNSPLGTIKNSIFLSCVAIPQGLTKYSGCPFPKQTENKSYMDS